MSFQSSCSGSILTIDEHLSVVLIGAGNVAWHLAQALQEYKKSDTDVVQIYSRNLNRARGLAALINGASATNSLDFSDSAANIFLIAVPDAAIEQVVAQAKFPANAVVAHTSGSIPLEALSKIGPNCGVFYPLQTFTKGKPVDFTKVPILLEGNELVYNKLWRLALGMSPRITFVSSWQRQQLHLAAVFACNFTNHLLGISHHILDLANLDLKLLRPLIEETMNKALQNPPFGVQTGPAVRGDKNVINRHLHMLQQHPNYQEIYDVLSASIEQKKGRQV